MHNSFVICLQLSELDWYLHPLCWKYFIDSFQDVLAKVFRTSARWMEQPQNHLGLWVLYQDQSITKQVLLYLLLVKCQVAMVDRSCFLQKTVLREFLSKNRFHFQHSLQPKAKRRLQRNSARRTVHLTKRQAIQKVIKKRFQKHIIRWMTLIRSTSC